jgi:hypothetical protein
MIIEPVSKRIETFLSGWHYYTFKLIDMHALDCRAKRFKSKLVLHISTSRTQVMAVWCYGAKPAVRGKGRREHIHMLQLLCIYQSKRQLLLVMKLVVRIIICAMRWTPTSQNFKKESLQQLIIDSEVNLHHGKKGVASTRQTSSNQPAHGDFSLAYDESFGLLEDNPNETWKKMQERAKRRVNHKYPKDPETNKHKPNYWYQHSFEPYFTCLHE